MPQLREKEVQERLKKKLEEEMAAKRARFSRLRELKGEFESIEEKEAREKKEEEQKISRKKLDATEKEKEKKKQGMFGFIGGLFGKKKEEAKPSTITPIPKPVSIPRPIKTGETAAKTAEPIKLEEKPLIQPSRREMLKEKLKEKTAEKPVTPMPSEAAKKELPIERLMKFKLSGSEEKKPEAENDLVAKRLQEMLARAQQQKPVEVKRVSVEEEKPMTEHEKEEMVDMLFGEVENPEEFKEKTVHLTKKRVEEFKETHDRLPTEKEYDEIAGEIFEQIKDKYDELEQKQTKVETTQGEQVDLSKLSRRERRKFEKEGQTPEKAPPSRRERRHGRKKEEEEEAEEAPAEEGTEDLFGKEERTGGGMDLGLEEEEGTGMDLGLEGEASGEETGLGFDLGEEPQEEKFGSGEMNEFEEEKQKGVCPKCKKPAKNTIYCPKCGGTLCYSCGKAEQLPNAIKLTCPSCGNIFKTIKR